MSNNLLYYVCCPYSHANDEVKTFRVNEYNRCSVYFANMGMVTTSAMDKLAVCKYGGMPETWEFWADHASALITKSYTVIVLMIDGWQDSTGVKGEIEIAESNNVRVEYFDPSTMSFVER